MRSFLVCLHDATPAYERETRAMIRDLAPLVGRRFSCGVVPDWDGRWPLAAHGDYCALLRDTSAELLLHGWQHRRRQGRGPVTMIAEGYDEMNGLDRDETRNVLERAQRDFAAAFGAPARGFLAPGWQRGHVRPGGAAGLEDVLGYLSLESASGRQVPLATSTWDLGRWGWLGHLGHGAGALLRSLSERVPVLAIHPRDLGRGYWPAILRLTRNLLAARREPATTSELLASRC